MSDGIRQGKFRRGIKGIDTAMPVSLAGTTTCIFAAELEAATVLPSSFEVAGPLRASRLRAGEERQALCYRQRGMDGGSGPVIVFEPGLRGYRPGVPRRSTARARQLNAALGLS